MSFHGKGCSAGLLILGFVAGCSGNVKVEGTATTGSGGTASSGGTSGGGTGGTGGAVTTGGAGGGAAVCGGKQGLVCPSTEWCQFEQGASCGCCDLVGECLPKPLDCGFDCPGVCGCDGQFYCNECLANLAGVGVDLSAECLPPTAPYELHVLPTNAPRFVLFHPLGQTCVRILVVGFGGPGSYPVDVTAPWQIESIVITNTLSDCKLGPDGWPVPIQDQSVEASSATGKIVVDLPMVPCGVTADMMLTFPQTSAWIPASVPFDSGYLSSNLPCDL